jgi:hypothetical protein
LHAARADARLIGEYQTWSWSAGNRSVAIKDASMARTEKELWDLQPVDRTAEVGAVHRKGSELGFFVAFQSGDRLIGVS